MPNSHVATTYVNEVTHIYVFLVSLSPNISLHFSLWLAVFELQAIRIQVHWMTHKWPWTLQHVQGQKCAICVSNIHESQISVIFALPLVVFLSFRPFWHKCTESPKITLNVTRSNIPHICVTSAHEPKFHSVLLYCQFEKLNDPQMSLGPTR